MKQTLFGTHLEDAKRLDQEDSLSHFRHQFHLQPNTIYLDGNSLGLCSKPAEQAILDVVSDWKKLAIDGWMNAKFPWFYLAEELGKKMAPLVGARSNEVVVTGGTTVNLHQLLSTFFHPTNGRNKILADTLNFPSDIYAIKSHLLLRGLDPHQHLICIPSRDGHTVYENDLIQAMTSEIALVLLPSVYYRSGQLLDMERLTAHAHQRGIVIGIDACHSVGAVPHAFHEWGVDFAFWCTYKYLNSGPGGAAAIYVHEKYHGIVPGLAGWFSSDKETQFEMSHQLNPAKGVGAFQIGTPHILSMAALIGSLSLFEEATIERIRIKSLQLTEYLMFLIKKRLANWQFQIVTPIEAGRRGGHVCLEHEEAVRICKALKERHVIPDYRAPSMIRLAPVALYTSFEDVYMAVERLQEIMVEKRYEQFPKEREVVA